MFVKYNLISSYSSFNSHDSAVVKINLSVKLHCNIIVINVMLYVEVLIFRAKYMSKGFQLKSN